MPINISNLQKLFELAAQEAAPQTPPAANSSPAPVPAESTPQAQQPAQVNQQSQTSGQAISVEKIVDHLNGIRSGKSFNDPLVFTAITNIFNGLSAAEKAVLDKALSQLDRSIEQITKQQSPPNPNNQEVKGPSVQPQFGNQTVASAATPLQGPQQAQQMMSSSPVSGMMSGLMAENSLKSLHESVNKPKTTIFVNGEEVPFGSEKHRGQLTIVLQGLEDLKNCYRKGSSVRYTLAGACQKVRKILKDTTDRAEVEPAAPDTLNSEMGV